MFRTLNSKCAPATAVLGKMIVVFTKCLYLESTDLGTKYLVCFADALSKYSIENNPLSFVHNSKPVLKAPKKYMEKDT